MRVFSGIQPTGKVHLGNYFGALINWVKMQDEGHDCFYSIVNQHAITIPHEVENLRRNTIELAATLLAIGLDPEKCTLFLQSDVPEHAQLAWVLTCLAPHGQMERMIQFKEKSKKNPLAVNLGLLSYPILQAADILLYKTEMVPVGKDQEQHLELTRILANKFNTTYQELFPEPKTLHAKTTKIVGLDGTAKMGKSSNNYISITEPSDSLWNKLRGATTDPARIKRSDPGTPEICNIYKLHTLFSTTQEISYVKDGCETAKIGCIDCKQILFKQIDSFIEPIRNKYEELMNDQEQIKQVLKMGAEKARSVAQKTLDEVYQLVGFKL